MDADEGFGRAQPNQAAMNAESDRRRRLMAGAPVPVPTKKPQPSLWDTAADLASSVGSAIVNAPARLKSVLTFPQQGTKQGPPDTMTGITSTATRGARGFGQVRKQLQKAAE